MENVLKHAMTSAIIGEILKRPDCPYSVHEAWKEYVRFWPKGHWHAIRKPLDHSTLWKKLQDELIYHHLLPEFMENL